jgi:hypothetical protein
MRGTLLELAASLMLQIESQIEGSRLLPIVLIAALSFGVYFTADVLLQIYSIHSVIVFVGL